MKISDSPGYENSFDSLAEAGLASCILCAGAGDTVAFIEIYEPV